MRVQTPSLTLHVPGGLAVSGCEKAEALADRLEARCQPVKDPSSPAVTEMVNEMLRAYEYAPTSEQKLSNPSQVLDAIDDLRVGKPQGMSGVPSRALRQ